jgi:hypothetical protein
MKNLIYALLCFFMLSFASAQAGMTVVVIGGGGVAVSYPTNADTPPFTDNDGSNGTNVDLNFQATVDANDLMVIVLCTDGTTTVTDWDPLTQHAWTEIYSNNDGSATSLHIAWYVADGSEDSAAIDITISASETAAAIIFRITGAKDPTTDPPEFGGVATGSGYSPDPGSFDPPAGNQNFMVIAVAAQDSDVDTEPTYPYADNNVWRISSTSGGCTIMVASDEISSDGPFNPSNFGTDKNYPWLAGVLTVEGS